MMTSGARRAVECSIQMKEIKLWSERWMQEQDIMLEDKITNKQSIQEKINAHSTKQVKKTTTW